MRNFDLIEQLVRAREFFKEHHIVKAVYLTCEDGFEDEDLRAIECQGLLLARDEDGFVGVVFLKDGQELPACVREKLHGNGYEHAKLWLEKYGEMDCWSDVETDASISGLIADVLLYGREAISRQL